MNRTFAAAPDQSQHQQKRLGALVRSAKTVHKLFDNLSVRSAAELPSQLAPSADPVLIRLALVGSQAQSVVQLAQELVDDRAIDADHEDQILGARLEVAAVEVAVAFALARRSIVGRFAAFSTPIRH